VVPAWPEQPAREGTAESGCVHAEESSTKKLRKRRNYFWSELLKSVFAIDILECPRCQGRLRLVAAIHAVEALPADSIPIVAPC
jgi:hypothetical protein